MTILEWIRDWGLQITCCANLHCLISEYPYEVIIEHMFLDVNAEVRPLKTREAALQPPLGSYRTIGDFTRASGSLAHDHHDSGLYFNVRRVYVNWFHRGIRRLQADLVSFTIEVFQGHFVIHG